MPWQNWATNEALWKLSVLSGDHPAQALQRVLASNQTTSRRSWAAYKLGERKNHIAAPALIRALDDQQTDVSGRAAAALVRIGKSALPTVRQRVLEPNTNPWLLAVLGYLGDKKDTTALLRYAELQKANVNVANVSLAMIKRRIQSEALDSIIPINPG